MAKRTLQNPIDPTVVEAAAPAAEEKAEAPASPKSATTRSRSTRKPAAAKKPPAAKEEAAEEATEEEPYGLEAVKAALGAREEGEETDFLRVLKARQEQSYLEPVNVRLPSHLVKLAREHCDRNSATAPSFQTLVAVLLDAYLQEAGELPKRPGPVK